MKKLRQHFADGVIRAFRRHGIEQPMHYSDADFSVTVMTQPPYHVYLQNAFRQCKLEDYRRMTAAEQAAALACFVEHEYRDFSLRHDTAAAADPNDTLHKRLELATKSDRLLQTLQTEYTRETHGADDA